MLVFERIHGDMAAIRAVARRERSAAAEAEVRLHEKLSPSSSEIDSLSSPPCTANFTAIQELVLMVGACPSTADQF